MKKMIQTVLAVMIIAGMTGCATPYMIDRRRDAADIFTARFGFGAGAKVGIGPVQAGILASSDAGGLRGGELSHTRLISGGDIDFLVLGYDEFVPPEGAASIVRKRNKEHKVRYAMLCIPAATQLTWPIPNKYNPSYFTQLEVVGGLFWTVRLGFNPGELLDFIFGWCGSDIYGDDIEAGRKELQSNKPAPVEPEYQRILQALRAHPDTVLSNESLYAKESTPSTRAFRTVLGDKTVHFEERILVELLNNLPPDNHWNREQIFARPELSSATIEQFYPKALEWGKHLNYTILANIATHSNTPRNVVMDLAKRRDVPTGGVEPAQRQMKKYVDDVLAGHSDNATETFEHLYEYAIQIQEAGWTHNGMAIILALAKSSLTPTNILVRIANYDDRTVQEVIVSNPNTPETTLTQLSASRFPEVRAKALKKKEPEPTNATYSSPAAGSKR